MTTTVPAPRALGDIRVTFAHLLRSEWLKLRTLRSTVWCYGLILLLGIGIGFLIAVSVPDATTISGMFGEGVPSGGGPAAISREHSSLVLVQTVTQSVLITQLIAVVLGVLLIGGEYSTGMIRSTFTAAPGRLGAYGAKVVVLGVTTLVVGLVDVAVTLALAWPFLAAKGYDLVLDASILWPMAGAAGYLTLIALLAFGFGAVIRNIAGGLAAGLGLVFVIPIFAPVMAMLLDAKWVTNVAAFLPSNAGGTMYAYNADTGGAASAASGPTGPLVGDVTLDPWQGLLVLAAWAALLLVLGGVLLKSRDV